VNRSAGVELTFRLLNQPNAWRYERCLDAPLCRALVSEEIEVDILIKKFSSPIPYISFETYSLEEIKIIKLYLCYGREEVAKGINSAGSSTFMAILAKDDFASR
jgi:hypothetical protein